MRPTQLGRQSQPLPHFSLALTPQRRHLSSGGTGGPPGDGHRHKPDPLPATQASATPAETASHEPEHPPIPEAAAKAVQAPTTNAESIERDAMLDWE